MILKNITMLRDLQAMTLGVIVCSMISWKNDKLIMTAILILSICMYVLLRNNIKNEHKVDTMLNLVLIHLLISVMLIIAFIITASKYSFIKYSAVMFLLMQSGAVLVKLKGSGMKYKLDCGLLIAAIILTIFI